MERQGLALAEGLAARGVRTTVVTLRNRPDLASREHCDGYELHRVGDGLGRWRSIGPVLRHLHRVRDCYDLICVCGFRTLGISAVLGAQTRGKPVVLRAETEGELSGSFFDPRLKQLGLTCKSPAFQLPNMARKALLRRADHFVAIAQCVKEEFLAERVPPENISVIPNCVDTSRFRPAAGEDKVRLRERLGLPIKAKIVCFVGRLVTYKGPLQLLRAWQQIVGLPADGQVGLEEPDYLLLFLGSGGSDGENCELEAQRFRTDNGLQDIVQFRGDADNVEDYLRAADAFALPTQKDSFAIAVVEAMACALPVLTTLVGGLADYVVPGRNAVAIPPDDVPAIRDGLLRLLKNRSLASRIAAAGLETAHSFTPARVVDLHLQLFRTLIDFKRAGRRGAPAGVVRAEGRALSRDPPLRRL